MQLVLQQDEEPSLVALLQTHHPLPQATLGKDTSKGKQYEQLSMVTSVQGDSGE